MKTDTQKNREKYENFLKIWIYIIDEYELGKIYDSLKIWIKKLKKVKLLMCFILPKKENVMLIKLLNRENLKK